ncbi:hypothetical protein [Pseudomonas phage vB_PaeM_PS119XW]|uniref:Virion structural protein n=1 Tax=Pseudomonas phage vB_PaeM_PS119XW TaxID=2601632 RepID=A0A5C1K7H8_9CAUD|nr:internal head protein [Pseudomonas phage vB_PaeM_PS119XW]QEM41832.1 hypothetical protein [Pseudomonas phage vB_PaeM_PS119XW]BEG72740.1 hypothetical protein RVBP21_3680 [Pseudomonas phage BRkr]
METENIPLDVESNPPEEIVVFDDSPAALSALLEKDEVTANRILDLIGGFENYPMFERESHLLDLGCEDFKGTVVGILDKVIAFLNRIMEDMFDGSLALSLAFDNILLRVEELNTLTRTTARRSKEPTFDVTTRIQNLCVRYKAINEVQGLIANLKNLEQIGKQFFDYNNEELIRAAFHIPQRITTAEELNKLVETIMLSNPVKMVSSNPLYSHRGYRHESLHLMGNYQVVVLDKSPEATGIDRMLGISVKLDNSERDPLPLPDLIKFQHFSGPVQITVLRQVEKMAEMFNRASGMSIRHRRKERIRSMLNIVKGIRNQIVNDQVEGADEAILRQFVEVLERYIDWLANPYLGILALAGRNLNAVLNVCRSNIK